MNKLLDWLDHRTGYRHLLTEALLEIIPGGSRKRYVLGSTLVFAFVIQVASGICLWMSYSPSTQTAWESVYYIKHHMAGGSFLRSVHHYAATAMVVLLVGHLIQVMVAKAYQKPREINFWIGLILMQIVLGLSLTGYLLPWDQKGYWATKVATEIGGSVGDAVPHVAIGGKEYGHQTLTRFFALHAGVLPGLLVFFLIIHIAVFRRHSITAHVDLKNPRPDEYFWPEQVLKDALACLIVIAVVFGLAYYVPAELTAPADPAENFSAARPEWYFLFLFQFLKFFDGERGKLLGAIIIPGAIMTVFVLMPFIARVRGGHFLNMTFLFAILAGAGLLTGMALHEDNYANLVDEQKFAEVVQAQETIAIDMRKHGRESKYWGMEPEKRLGLLLEDDPEMKNKILREYANYRKFLKSRDFLEAKEAAHRDGERVIELASTIDPDTGETVPLIPPTGALTLLRNDPQTQGPKLFARYCVGCHDHVDTNGHGISMIRPLVYRDIEGERVREVNGAPNLYGFASRNWLTALLDPEQIAKVTVDEETALVTGAPFFGNTKHREGEMAGFVQGDLAELDDEQKRILKNIVVALSSEAQLTSQAEADAKADEDGTIAAGREAFTETFDTYACGDCHKLHDEGDLGTAPDLTGYGSRQWLIDFISDPNHERFYGYVEAANDRMPAFDPPDDPGKQQLTPEKLGLIADWLRGDWRK